MVENLAEEVGELCDTTVDVRGHWLYVRKCKAPSYEGLILPDWTMDYSLWVEVLAKGTKVARPRNWTKKLLQHRKAIRCMEDCYDIGDLVLCPDDHPWGIMSSPYAKCEKFVDELVPLLRYREPNV